MKTREFQLDKLARAREIQDEAAGLHIPMPVLSWQYEVKDKDGETIEKGTGKANSYTRNALNNLAWFVGFAPVDIMGNNNFVDGYISQKDTSGNIKGYVSNGTSNVNVAIKTIGRYPVNDLVVRIGTGTTETLDDYAQPDYACATSVGASFNSTTRKLITVFSGSWQNSTGASVDITEAGGTCLPYYSGEQVLMLHDVFAPVTVPNGGGMIWTYVTEVSYPNP